MSGKNAVTAFKEKVGVSSTFLGGNKPPEEIGIVGLSPDHPMYIEGVDVPIEDWNQDLWDEARLSLALSDPIDPEKIIKTLDLGGSIPPVAVVIRRGLALSTEGRRRVLGTRTANRILIKRGTLPDALIELGCFLDKSTDVEVSVRIGNSGRLEDPPFVKAANAARLLSRGKSEEQIAAILEAEPNTVGNWLAYAKNLGPEIKALIETGDKAGRVPFAIGVELAKGSGEGEHAAQNAALAYLFKTGAKLTGEKGRENARNVIRAIMSGTMPEAPAADEPTPPAPESSGSKIVIMSGTDHPLNLARAAGPAESKPPSTHQKPPSGPKVTTATPKLSWSAIREIAAHLEPSANDPHQTEADYVAHAIFQVINGADPSAEGLATWPRIQARFRKVVRSGADVITPQPRAKPAEKPPENNTAPDAIRSLACPNRQCVKGVDKSTGKSRTCPSCEGYGKISPHRAEQLKKKKAG